MFAAAVTETCKNLQGIIHIHSFPNIVLATADNVSRVIVLLKINGPISLVLEALNTFRNVITNKKYTLINLPQKLKSENETLFIFKY